MAKSQVYIPFDNRVKYILAFITVFVIINIACLFSYFFSMLSILSYLN